MSPASALFHLSVFCNERFPQLCQSKTASISSYPYYYFPCFGGIIYSKVLLLKLTFFIQIQNDKLYLETEFTCEPFYTIAAFFSRHQNRKLMDCSPNTDCPLRLPLHWVFQPVFSISSFCLISLIYSSALHFPSVSLEAPNDQLLGISKHFFKFSAILVSVRLRDVPTKSILQ